MVLYALARYGDRFVHTYVIEQVVERALTAPPFDRGPTLFPFVNYPYVREFPAPAGAGRRAVPAVVAVALVLALVGAPPTVPWQSDVEQRAFAADIETATPPDATLYVDAGPRDKPLFPFAFYLNRPRGDVVGRPADRDLEYALLAVSPEQLPTRYDLDPPLVTVSERRLPFSDTADEFVAFARPGV